MLLPLPTEPKHLGVTGTKQLRRALEINPDDGVLMTILALKLGTYNKHQEAEDLIERAEELFQQGLGKFIKVREKICQIFHHRTANFHLYHTKQEVEAIEHYAQKLKADRRATLKRQSFMGRLFVGAGDGRRLSKRQEAMGRLRSVEYSMTERTTEGTGFYEKALDCDENNDEYLSALCELMELQ
ncbi:interferon-induced protein with tetratricopeptide repeats 5-like isoform X2 [Lates japonicus]|uniref:Interferon-induced protein with tetratricopeptide repeats 5-like isoform X2 n=1 Tax=Lates japonicus TaxID=270547 RepID=A0AAD3NA38_LATJO|nr:interferon-induced protein with tetratricopeptide repeats 5-like isoform X2 [Lates japonicus]